MKQRYSVWDEMQRMHEHMDLLFNNFFSDDPFMLNKPLLLESTNDSSKKLMNSNYRQPVSDIYETDTDVVAELELPGLDKKNIEVNVDDRSITVVAKINSENKIEDKKKGMYRFERSCSGFSRQFSLPTNVDANKANAEYKDGVLKITVPKLKLEEKKKKLLEIK